MEVVGWHSHLTCSAHYKFRTKQLDREEESVYVLGGRRSIYQSSNNARGSDGSIGRVGFRISVYEWAPRTYGSLSCPLWPWHVGLTSSTFTSLPARAQTKYLYAIEAGIIDPAEEGCDCTAPQVRVKTICADTCQDAGMKGVGKPQERDHRAYLGGIGPRLVSISDRSRVGTGLPNRENVVQF